MPCQNGIKMTNRCKRSAIVKELGVRIVTRQIAAGAALDEIRIADEFHVSRTPIREIVHELAGIGLLVRDPASGFRTRVFGLHEIVAHLQAMDHLFPPALSLAAIMRNDADIESMHGQLENIETSFNLNTRIQASTAVREFFAATAAATHNPVIQSVLMKLFDEHIMIRVDFHSVIPDAEKITQLEKNKTIYRKFLSTVEAGDFTGLEEAAKERIDSSREFIFERLMYSKKAMTISSAAAC